MYKRIAILFCLLMFFITILITKTYSLSQRDFLLEAATKQSTYKLDIAKLRGTIYDCRKVPLTGNEKISIAAVVPSVKNMNAFSKILSTDEMHSFINKSKDGLPFAFKVNDKLNIDNTDMFLVPIRYSNNQLAPHIIGYLNGSENGVYGIEKAYEDYLANTGSHIAVKYKVDAVNRLLENGEREVDDKTYLQTKGVVLTLDERLQRACETIAKKHLKKGAVIVTKIPDCEIRACVSIPDFSPLDISSSLSSEDSPLVNRAFSSYNIGSIFKLVTAACALESGYKETLEYDCSGGINVGDCVFHCFNGISHGKINMEKAIAYSCNGYFVNLVEKLNHKKLIDLSKNFGFGSSIELAPGMISDEGILPVEKELESKSNLANFSFGQGCLMVTPLQVAGFINAIASDGIYTAPSLVKGLVNENLEYTKVLDKPLSKKVISKKTAQILKNGMVLSVTEGTSKKGEPLKGGAGAKTSTAETGIKVGERPVIQAWYAGFYPLEKPKYTIIVLAEDAVGGGESCGPVFKEISNYIYENILECMED